MSSDSASDAWPADRPKGPVRALLLLVKVYRVTLSPFLGGHCRYVPSCSVYAEEALRRHGAIRGAAPRRLAPPALSSLSSGRPGPGPVGIFMEERRLLARRRALAPRPHGVPASLSARSTPPDPRPRPAPLRCPRPRRPPLGQDGRRRVAGVLPRRRRGVRRRRRSGAARGGPGPRPDRRLHEPGSTPRLVAPRAVHRRPEPGRGDGGERRGWAAASRPRDRRRGRGRAAARGALPAVVREPRLRRRRADAALRVHRGRHRRDQDPALPRDGLSRFGLRLGPEGGASAAREGALGARRRQPHARGNGGPGLSATSRRHPDGRGSRAAHPRQGGSLAGP